MLKLSFQAALTPINPCPLPHFVALTFVLLSLYVGAVDFYWKDGTPVRESYSSTGKGLDIMSFSNIDTDDLFGLKGTSFSAPTASGMLALYVQLYREKVGAISIFF